MKKFIRIAVAVLAVGMTVTVAGCSSNSKNTVLTSSNWFLGTSYKGIQSSFIVDGENGNSKEIIKYTVGLEAGSATNTTYSAEYTNGEYVTEFYAGYYDWTDADIPEGYKGEADSELVYFYKTDYKISVQFTLKSSGEKTEVFNDTVTTECAFRSAGNNLQPVYSKQTVSGHFAASYQAGVLAATYVAVERTYENFYNYAGTEVTSFTTANGETVKKVTEKIDKTDNSLFDEASLQIAVRSMKLSSSLSQTVNLFSAPKGIGTYTVSGKSEALGTEERAAITTVLTDKGLYVPKTATDDDGNETTDAGVNSVAVSIGYSGGTMSGSTQTIWYAAIENSSNNTGRATMLKMAMPLSYGTGTLTYTLSEIESTIK